MVASMRGNDGYPLALGDWCRLILVELFISLCYNCSLMYEQRVRITLINLILYVIITLWYTLPAKGPKTCPIYNVLTLTIISQVKA